MRNFVVSIPICGAIHVAVEAENEADAKAIAWDLAGEDENSDVEWEMHEHIVKGNIFNGSYNQINVEDQGEVEEDDDSPELEFEFDDDSTETV